jgi:mono/diheme cytochrome c family protein
MARLVFFIGFVGLTLFVGCSDDGASAPSGEALYAQRHEDGNSFACATCHAIEEPAPDGLRRPGHPIGDAANRPSFKNGQLDALIEAVNSCRVEWMAASAFEPTDPSWLALSDYLAVTAGGDPAPALSYEIAAPPDELDGGDAMAGQALFNRSCVVCHGENARGTERGPALVASTLSAALIATRVRTSGSRSSAVYEGLSGGRMPFWAADRLNDDELRDLIAFVLAADTGGGGGTGGTGGGQLRECDATHPKVGQVAELQTFAHQVSGTAVIVDDCTVRVDDFVFDGGGIDVRFYGGVGGNYETGYSMSEQDLRRAGGYDGTEVVYAQLPENRTLDELDGISVWCVPVAASFGDGLFREP